MLALGVPPGGTDCARQWLAATPTESSCDRRLCDAPGNRRPTCSRATISGRVAAGDGALASIAVATTGMVRPKVVRGMHSWVTIGEGCLTASSAPFDDTDLSALGSYPICGVCVMILTVGGPLILAPKLVGAD